MNLKFFSLLFLTIIVIQTDAYAGVFKCVKENGAVYYNDRPCTSGLKEKKLTFIKKPPSAIVRNKKTKALDQKQEANTDSVMTQKHFSPADQALYLKQHEDAIRKKEQSVDDGTYEMTAAEKKSMKIVEKRYAKIEAERLRKEAIKQSKAKERNRLAKIEQQKRSRKLTRQIAKSNAKKRVTEYKKYMESKERSGAMMTAAEREWRDADAGTTIKNAQYHHDVNSVGSKEYKDHQQALRAAELASGRQMKANNEFNNTRYEGNDINYQ